MLYVNEPGRLDGDCEKTDIVTMSTFSYSTSCKGVYVYRLYTCSLNSNLSTIHIEQASTQRPRHPTGGCVSEHTTRLDIVIAHPWLDGCYPYSVIQLSLIR